MSDFKCALIHTSRLFKNEEGALVSDITYAAGGLFSLASEIKKEGLDVEIIHLAIEKYLDKNFLLSDYIKQNDIKFLAFSLQWHPQSYDTIETIRTVKEKCPDIYISLGGLTASYFSEEILSRFPFVDSIIKGEGEIPIRLLAGKIKNRDYDLSDVPNLIWRKKGDIIRNEKKFVATNEDLDSFEFFNTQLMKHYSDYSRIPFILEYNKENELSANPPTVQGITLGRGCVGNCAYCGGGFRAVKAVTGRDFISYRSPKRVIDEISKLKSYGIQVFRFVFDPHPKNRKHLLNLFYELKKAFNRDLTVEFTAYSIPDEEFLDVFADSFSKDSKIAISADFYNEDLRKKYRTFFFTNKKLEEILEYMENKQIKSDLFFSIVPNVNEEENKKSFEYGKKLADKFKCIQGNFIYPIEVEPASPWTIHPEKYGLHIKEKHFIDYYNDTKCIQNSFENVNIF